MEKDKKEMSEWDKHKAQQKRDDENEAFEDGINNPHKKTGPIEEALEDFTRGRGRTEDEKDAYSAGQREGIQQEAAKKKEDQDKNED